MRALVTWSSARKLRGANVASSQTLSAKIWWSGFWKTRPACRASRETDVWPLHVSWPNTWTRPRLGLRSPSRSEEGGLA
jgi:hypothetical protein